MAPQESDSNPSSDNIFRDDEKKEDREGGGVPATGQHRSKFDKFRKKLLVERSKSAPGGEKTCKEETEREQSTRKTHKKKTPKKGGGGGGTVQTAEADDPFKEDYVPEPDQVSHRTKKYGKKAKHGGGGGGESDTETSRERKKKKKQQPHHHVLPSPAASESEPKTSLEPSDSGASMKDGSGKTQREKGGGENETATQRERRKNKHNKKEEVVELSVLHYMNEETEAEKRAKEEAGPICTEAFGYGVGFPNWMLEVPRTISFEVKPPAKLPMVKVFRTMIVYEVPPELREQIDVGDVICKFNDTHLGNREEYTKLLAEASKLSEVHTIRYTFYRTLRTRKIAAEKVETEVPIGFEILRDAFDYLFAYLTFVPRSQIGVSIKSYNGKVFVSAIDNQQNTIARKSLLVGDAILAIDDNVVSNVRNVEDALLHACAKKKFVKLLIERARSASGIKIVKLVLGAEKTVEINPKMGEDILELCNMELRNMDAQGNAIPKSIYRSKSKKRPQHQRVNVANESIETPISTDVNNITLLATTPPVPTARPLSEFDGTGGGYVQGTPAQIQRIRHQHNMQQLRQQELQQSQHHRNRPKNFIFF